MKHSFRNLLSMSGLTACLLCVACNAFANPQDGVVITGQSYIIEADKKVDVYQQSQKAVIDWRSFDINSDEQTQFHQPNSDSITVNRVNSPSASLINGKLTANGNIVVINQNGLMFGSNAVVDVNGLVATSADIDNDSFMQNDVMVFDKAGRPDATVVNAGHITVKEAGLAGFVAPNIINAGIIQARLAHVQLASGDTATLDLYGDGLLKVAVSDQVTSQLVSNTGTITADGGTIALTASAGKAVVNNLIIAHGHLQAQSIGQRNGKIIITAEGSNAVAGNIQSEKGKKSGSSTVVVTGSLDASGKREGEQGGKIQVTGDNIALINGALIDATGYQGESGTTDGKEVSAARQGSAGGDILIGGDYLGSGDTSTAQHLYVDDSVSIFNDAIFEGDAGRTILWSDDTTTFNGNIYARALGGQDIDNVTWNATTGGRAGNGGFVETSGHDQLTAGGYVDLTSSGGERGTYFLDPADITIYGYFNPAYTNSNGDINLGSNLKLWLDASDTANLNLTYNALGSTVTSSSGNTITVNSNSGLVVGARIRLGGVGAVTAASTVGNDTYTITNIAGTTITLSQTLSANYTGSAVYQGYISQLTDKSGTGNTATQSTTSLMPLWISNGLNGIGVASFNGSNNMELAAGSGTSLSFASNFSIFNVIRSDSAGQTYQVWFYKGENLVDGYYLETNKVIYKADLNPSAPGNYTKIETPTFTYDVAQNVNFIVDNSGNGMAYMQGVSGAAALFGSIPNNMPVTLGTYVADPTFGLTGTINEIQVYNTALSQDVHNLLEQYQAAKWGTALTPPGTGVTEVDKATAADGYSSFTTRYLERLSQSANISLLATNINLDLKNDTLNLASGRSFTLTAGNSINSLSAGSIVTNNGNITLSATNGIHFDHDIGFDTNGGNLIFNNDIVLGANQTAWNTDAGTITFNGSINGGYDLASAAASYNFAADIGHTTPLDELVITSGSGLSLPSINARRIQLETTANTSDIVIPVGKALTASGTGSSLILNSGRNFVNNAGSNALSSSNGRWLIYSNNPDDDVLGSLANDFRRFSCSFSGTCPALDTGNGFLYGYTPLLKVTTNKTITYGDIFNGTGYVYTLSDYLDDDENDDNVSGTLTAATAYVLGNNAGSYNLDYASGTLTSDIGYGFDYVSSTSGLTVLKKILDGTVNDLTLNFNDLLPALGKLNVNWTGFYNTDSVANLTSASIDAGGYMQGSPAGTYTLSATSLNSTNYQLGTVNNGTLTVASISPPTPLPIQEISSPSSATELPPSIEKTVFFSEVMPQGRINSINMLSDFSVENINSLGSLPESFANGSLKIADDVIRQYQICMTGTELSCNK